jgi:hypothetical protein
MRKKLTDIGHCQKSRAVMLASLAPLLLGPVLLPVPGPERRLGCVAAAENVLAHKTLAPYVAVPVRYMLLHRLYCLFAEKVKLNLLRKSRLGKIFNRGHFHEWKYTFYFRKKQGKNATEPIILGFTA